MMENVLKIVNAPTNSEMKANTSSAVEKNDSAWLIELVCSLTTVCPVTTSVPRRQHLRDGPLDRGLVRPRRGHDVDVVDLAHLSEDLLRGRERERGQRHAGQVVGRCRTGRCR